MMPKFNPKVVRMILGACVVVIIVFIALYLCRGIFRSEVVSFAAHKHKAEIEKVTADQLNVNSVLSPLGLQFSENASGSCQLDIAVQWRTAVDCAAEVDTSTAPNVASLDKRVVQQVGIGMHKLGWQGGPGNDDVQALSYDKTVNDIKCNIQIFSNDNFGYPSYPARLLCDHDYYYFGNPYKSLD